MQLKQLVTGRRGTVLIGIALLATVMAGGSAVATGLVTSRDILQHTIRNVDLHDGSVGSNSIRTGSFRRAARGCEVRNGTAGPRGATGAVGARGAIGPHGPPGEIGVQGPSGVAGYSRTQHAVSTTDKAPGEIVTEDVDCSPGQVAVGGGAEPEGENITLHGSYPVEGNDRGWRVSVSSDDNEASYFFNVWVVCLTAPEPVPVG
jgi:hypothetical protein